MREILSTQSTTTIWVGMNDSLENSKYVYDSTNEEVTMELNWFPLYPKNTTEETYMAAVYPEIKYKDLNGEEEAMVVCEKS